MIPVGRDPAPLADGELLHALELATEGLAVHVGHHVVEQLARRSGVEERQEVRVLKTSGNADLRKEPLSAEDRE
jgi:hypothetical protein